MAFLLLFAGLLMGSALVGLSESERDYYYTNRVMMNYLGNKDGCDIYRDPMTGTFYADDGWEVRRVGTQGFVPHPIDRERLRQLCTKYNPENIKWVDFLLASFEGQEQQLWRNFFDKYELGPKPKEPTWGKGIRKQRWARYYEELDAWEGRKRELTPKFEEECRQWNERRREYDRMHHEQVSRAAGTALLQRALSSGMIIRQPSTSDQQMYKAAVPQGLRPGDTFLAQAGNQTVSVTVPPNTFPGQEITFQAPGAVMQVVQPVVAQPARASSNESVPTASYVASAAPAAPPPAIGAGNPPPVQKASSIRW